MVNIDDYTLEAECDYKGERYSARDNGAVWRHSREGKKPRPTDCQWTFGKPNDKTGYMEIASVRVHRIAASAFHGEPPTKEHVVDHIDTNKRNNRPENLRWVTRLENVLLNPITAKRIAYVCGSVEAFLADPAKYRSLFSEPHEQWMQTVSAEEARVSLERMLVWAKSDKPSSGGGSLDKWIFNRQIAQNPPVEYIPQGPDYIMSLTPGAAQRNLTILDKPVEYPATPKLAGDDPLMAYVNNLTEGTIFFRNHNGPYLVVNSGFSAGRQSLYVLTEAGYVWREQNGDHVPVLISERSEAENDVNLPLALTEVTYEDGLYIHEKMGFGFHPREEIEEQFHELTRGWKNG